MDKKNIIVAERDSVCMGDDASAPHWEEFEFGEAELLSGFTEKLKKYVPPLNDGAWCVECAGQFIAVLIFDKKTGYRYELPMGDCKLEELPEKRIYCRPRTISSVQCLFSSVQKGGSR